MGRRISDSDPQGKKPCAFCRTMRVVMVFAVIVAMLMAYANKLEWLKDINFTSLFSYLVVAFFIAVLGFRVWDEYGRSRPSLTEAEAKRAKRERQFDELDAKEALDAKLAESEPVTPFNTVLDEQSEVLQHEDPQQDGVVANKTQFSTQPEQLDLLGFSTPKKPD